MRVLLTGIASLCAVVGQISVASAAPALSSAELAAGCWAQHVAQGEKVRPGTPTEKIAAEDASFWAARMADEIKDEPDREKASVRVLQKVREDMAKQPDNGFMMIAMNASVCQTMRTELQPGYNPVQQNNRN